MRTLACVLVALAVAGCSRDEISSRTRKETTLVVPRAVEKPGTAGLASMFANADGSERATVRRVKNGYLELSPEGQGEVRERLRLLPTAPILRGRAAMSTEALRPGESVRVYFKNAAGREVPEALGVVLDDTGER